MIHNISLAEVLEQYVPPAKVLNVSSCDDTVFVRICDVDQDHRSEKHTEVAEISVSLPALIEALNLLAVDHEREDLRPVDHDGKARETKFAGRRLTVAGVAPWSAVAALTTHYRHTPEPSSASDSNADSNRERGHQRTTADTSARDLVLPHWSPVLSTVAYDYGSEGWGFESLRARFSDQRECCELQGCNPQKVVA